MSRTMMRNLLNLAPPHTWGVTTLPVTGISAHGTLAMLDFDHQDVGLLAERRLIRIHASAQALIFDVEGLLRFGPVFQNELRRQLISARIDPTSYLNSNARPAAIEACRQRAADVAAAHQPKSIRLPLVAALAMAQQHPNLVLDTRPLTEAEQTALTSQKLRHAHIELWDYRRRYWRLGNCWAQLPLEE